MRLHRGHRVWSEIAAALSGRGRARPGARARGPRVGTPPKAPPNQGLSSGSSARGTSAAAAITELTAAAQGRLARSGWGVGAQVALVSQDVCAFASLGADFRPGRPPGPRRRRGTVPTICRRFCSSTRYIHEVVCGCNLAPSTRPRHRCDRPLPRRICPHDDPALDVRKQLPL